MNATIEQFRKSATRVSLEKSMGTPYFDLFSDEEITVDVMFYGSEGSWGHIETVRVLFPDNPRMQGGEKRGCYGMEMYTLELENFTYMGNLSDMETKLYDWMLGEGALEIPMTWQQEQDERVNNVVSLTVDAMYKGMAEEFQEIKSGDVSPCGLGQLEGAIRAATTKWCEGNK